LIENRGGIKMVEKLLREIASSDWENMTLEERIILVRQIEYARDELLSLRNKLNHMNTDDFLPRNEYDKMNKSDLWEEMLVRGINPGRYKRKMYGDDRDTEFFRELLRKDDRRKAEVKLVKKMDSMFPSGDVDDEEEEE
jgi:hypothetical protein